MPVECTLCVGMMPLDASRYIQAKNATFLEAFRLVSDANGTFYNKGAPSNKTKEECISDNVDPVKE